MKYLVTLLLTLPFLTACSKDDLEIMMEAREKMAGTYDILRIDVTTYDTLGNMLYSNSIIDPGTIELTLNSSGIPNENWINFPISLFDNTVAFGKLKGQKFFYWDTDPAGKRFMIWGIDQGGASIHTTFTQGEGSGLSLVYTESNNSFSPQGNTLARKEFYQLKKR